mgnify:CR=1 FL=1
MKNTIFWIIISFIIFEFVFDKIIDFLNATSWDEPIPKIVNDSFEKRGLHMVIDEREAFSNGSPFDTKLKLLNHKLYLINTSDSLVELEASDSRLYIQAEALNQNKIRR